MPTSWEGALPLSSHFEMHLQKGSVYCICCRVSLQSSMSGGGSLTLSVFDVDGTSAGGAVFVGVSVLLWVWKVGQFRGDVTTMLMEALEVSGVSLSSTICERQSAVLLWAINIHSKVMLYVASSNHHLFTLFFAFFPFRNLCRGLWSLCSAMSDPCR